MERIEVSLLASGLGHKQLTYEMFGNKYTVQCTTVEFIILSKLLELQKQADDVKNKQ